MEVVLGDVLTVCLSWMCDILLKIELNLQLVSYLSVDFRC